MVGGQFRQARRPAFSRHVPLTSSAAAFPKSDAGLPDTTFVVSVPFPYTLEIATMLLPFRGKQSARKSSSRRRGARLELCPEFLEQRLLLTSLVPSPNPTPGGPPPSSTPPAIVGEQILTAGQGKHTHLVGFELIFSEALDVSRARRAANYIVTDTDKVGQMVVTRRVKLHAEYSPASNAVNLILSGRPTFGLGGQIDVNASSPAGVTDTSGDDLVGGPLHLPGIDPVFAILPKGRGNAPGASFQARTSKPHLSKLVPITRTFELSHNRRCGRYGRGYRGRLPPLRAIWPGIPRRLWFPLLLLSMARR